MASPDKPTTVHVGSTPPPQPGSAAGAGGDDTTGTAGGTAGVGFDKPATGAGFIVNPKESKKAGFEVQAPKPPKPKEKSDKTIGGGIAQIARPAVTLSRMAWTRLDSTHNILQQSAEKGMLPFYAQRLDEFRQMSAMGLSDADLNQAIAELNKLLEEKTAYITPTLNRVYKGILAKINPKLSDYAQTLVLKQFGKGEVNLMRIWANVISRPNRDTDNLIDWYGRKEVNMIIESLQSALFFNHIKLQQDEKDDKKFKILWIDGSQIQELVTVEVNPQQGIISFNLSPKCAPDKLDTGLIALADVIASHRQLRDNAVTLSLGNDPAAIIRLAELLLCKHHMFLDLSEVKAFVDSKVAEPQMQALQERWEFLQKFSQTFDPRNTTKLAVKQDLREYGFTKDQFKSNAKYRECLNYLFEQVLNDAKPYADSGYNTHPAVKSENRPEPGMRKTAAPDAAKEGKPSGIFATPPGVTASAAESTLGGSMASNPAPGGSKKPSGTFTPP